jgi:predicted acetyltransferase
MKPALNVTIELAPPEEKPVFERLFQLYLHDFSEFAEPGTPDREIGQDGRFPDDTMDRYWRPNRQVWSIRVDGNRAGFALVNDWAPSGRPIDYALGDFFILRKYRRNGIGRTASRMLFKQLPGTWELAVIHYNAPGLLFWRKALTAVPGSNVDELVGDGERWKGWVFRLAPVK